MDNQPATDSAEAIQARSFELVNRLRKSQQEMHQRMAQLIQANGGQVDPSSMQASLVQQGEHLQLLTMILINNIEMTEGQFFEQLAARYEAVSSAIAAQISKPNIFVPN